jgi:hypothetical protein
MMTTDFGLAHLSRDGTRPWVVVFGHHAAGGNSTKDLILNGVLFGTCIATNAVYFGDQP